MAEKKFEIMNTISREKKEGGSSLFFISYVINIYVNWGKIDVDRIN